jgi:NAD(P)-dependent dehydrogenase (short-subunit alcohol dehydrogenase family)
MRHRKGKTAVVTGAASGIGRALALRWAREGMRVVLADIEEGPLAEARDEVAALGPGAIAVKTDVSKRQEVESLAARAFEAFGAVHLLCNNAGVIAGGPVWELAESDWDWVFRVNVFGVLYGIAAFVPRMIEQREGHVVNTASIAGILSAPLVAPYCASKHAVVAISECLQYDLALIAGGAVRVSVLCPNWVRTNFADAARNRPAALSPPLEQRASPYHGMVDEMLRTGLAGGIDPAEVADQVASAIAEERFWVLTHADTRGAVERHAHDIVEAGALESYLGP